MKKNTIKSKHNQEALTIGMDIGDTYCHLCLLDAEGEVIEETRCSTKPKTLRHYFDSSRPARVAIEVGTHSPWISRLIEECGHEMIVANPRKLRLIYQNNNKT